MKKIIILLSFFLNFAFNQESQKIAVLSYLNGSCIVNNSRLDTRESNLSLGSSLFNDDIIFTGADSECHITYDDGLTYVVASENSKIILTEDNFSRSLKLQYGQILVENSKSSIKTYVSTPSNEIYINNNKVWVESQISLDDKVFPIFSNVDIYNYLSKESGKLLPLKTTLISKSGDISYLKKSDELPDYLNKENELRKKYLNNKYDPLYLNPYDLIPIYNKSRKKDKYSSFSLNYNAGVRMMNSDSFLGFSVYPYYKKGNLSIGGNIEFFYGSSSGLLDNWDDIADLFEKMYIRYSESKKKNKLLLNAGKIDKITFGHGYLVENLSNSFNYPYQRNFGINLFYKFDKDFMEFHFFSPSIREYFNNGGMIGFHASLFVSHKFPLKLGFGLVVDLNQFSLSSNTYNFSNQLISNKSRSVGAIEFDYNYEVVKTMDLEINLYGEFVGIWHPENIYYLQIDGVPYTDDVRWRKGTWGMLGPGIDVKIDNKYNVKFALNVNSAGFQPQYFNKNYLNNRSIYYNASDENLEFPLITEQIQMMNEFDISENSDSTEFLVPKEIHPILSKTFNSFPTFGFTTEFGYTYKNVVDISGLLSLFIQNRTNTLDLISEGCISCIYSYYSIGANISIRDKVLKNVSFLDFYLSNIFFWSADDIDKMLYGLKMGFKLPFELLLIFDVGQVFYDYNLINDKRKMMNAGIEIKMDF